MMPDIAPDRRRTKALVGRAVLVTLALFVLAALLLVLGKFTGM
jgi:hypothetical protein